MKKENNDFMCNLYNNASDQVEDTLCERLKMAIETIDNEFGKWYAKQNPVLTGSIVSSLVAIHHNELSFGLSCHMEDKVSNQKRIAIALETLVSQGNYLSAEDETKPELELEKAFKAAEEVKPAIEVVQSRALTHEDLKAICLEKARADNTNRGKLKALLATYDANKAIDVPIAKLAEIIGKIEAGEF